MQHCACVAHARCRVDGERSAWHPCSCSIGPSHCLEQSHSIGTRFSGADFKLQGPIARLKSNLTLVLENQGSKCTDLGIYSPLYAITISMTFLEPASAHHHFVSRMGCTTRWAGANIDSFAWLDSWWDVVRCVIRLEITRVAGHVTRYVTSHLIGRVSRCVSRCMTTVMARQAAMEISVVSF